MKLDLTPRQAEELRGSINRTLIDMYAECDDEWGNTDYRQTDTCIKNGRTSEILQRILAKLTALDKERER